MKAAKVGRCKHCNALAFHKCRRCEGWLCVFGDALSAAPCGRLRKVAREVGRYDLVCGRGCRKTRSDAGKPKKDERAKVREEMRAGGLPEEEINALLGE